MSSEAIQDLNQASANAREFTQSARALFQQGVLHAVQTLTTEALRPHSETQQRVLAALRTIVGVSGIYFAGSLGLPLVAVLASCVAAAMPGVATPLLEAVEVITTQLWHHLHIKTRMTLFAVALAVLLLGWSMISVPLLSAAVSLVASVISIKVSGELTLHNLDKERRHAKRAIAEQQEANNATGPRRNRQD